MSREPITHSRYIQAHQLVPFFFHLKAEDIDEDFDFVQKHGIENIALSQYEPYSVSSLNIIPQKLRPAIKKLKVFIENADLSGLHEFQNLEELSIGEKASTINLTGLNRLVSLYVFYSGKISGFSSLANLKNVTVVQAKPDLFSHFSFKGVEEVNLFGGILPSNLSLLNPTGNLCRLELYGIRNEFDLKGILESEICLQSLKIEKCKKLLGLEEVLGKTRELVEFSLIDSVVLADTKFIVMLPKLKTLIVLGSSYFINGDLNDLKKLDWVSIDDKRHYNVHNNALGKKI